MPAIVSRENGHLFQRMILSITKKEVTFIVYKSELQYGRHRNVKEQQGSEQIILSQISFCHVMNMLSIL